MQASGLLVLGTYFGMYHVCVTWQVDLSLDIGQCRPMVFLITSLCAAHYRFCRHYPIVVPSKRCLETQSYYLPDADRCMVTKVMINHRASVRRVISGSAHIANQTDAALLIIKSHLLRIIYGIQDRNLNVDQLSIEIDSDSFPTLRHSSNAYAYLPRFQGCRTQGIEFRSSMGKERTESRLSQDRHRARERTMDRTYCVTLEGALFIFYFCFDIALRSL